MTGSVPSHRHKNIGSAEAVGVSVVHQLLSPYARKAIAAIRF